MEITLLYHAAVNQHIPMVTGEHDYGIIHQAFVLQQVQQFSYPVVHIGCEGSIGTSRILQMVRVCKVNIRYVFMGIDPDILYVLGTSLNFFPGRRIHLHVLVQVPIFFGRHERVVWVVGGYHKAEWFVRILLSNPISIRFARIGWGIRIPVKVAVYVFLCTEKCLIIIAHIEVGFCWETQVPAVMDCV